MSKFINFDHTLLWLTYTSKIDFAFSIFFYMVENGGIGETTNGLAYSGTEILGFFICPYMGNGHTYYYIWAYENRPYLSS